MSARIAVLLSCIGALCACGSTSGISEGYSLDMNPGMGVVFVSIAYSGMYTPNSIYIRKTDGGMKPFAMTFGGDTLLIPANPSKDFSAFGYDSLGHSGALVSRDLPPGNYAVEAWSVCDRCMSDQKFSVPFTIRAGEATYAGSYEFVHKMVGLRVTGGGGTLLDEFARDRGVFEQKFPAMHGVTETDAVAGLKTPMDLGTQ